MKEYTSLAIILCQLAFAPLAFAETNAPKSALPQAPRSRIANGKVRTPSGLVDQECVFEIPDGARFDSQTGDVKRENMIIDHHPPCTPEQMGQTKNPISDHWIECTWATPNAGNLQFFNVLFANWRVPIIPIPLELPMPSETIYFFPSLQAFGSQGAEIIQPVLQYGCDGCDDWTWSMASWYCGPTYCRHSPFVDVSTGDEIAGTVQIMSSIPLQYEITTTDTTTGWWTKMPQATLGVAFNTVQGGVLETYDVVTCGQLPYDTNHQEFYNVLVSQAGPTWKDTNFITPQWGSRIVSNPNPNCNYSVSWVQDYISQAWLWFN